MDISTWAISDFWTPRLRLVETSVGHRKLVRAPVDNRQRADLAGKVSAENSLIRSGSGAENPGEGPVEGPAGNLGKDLGGNSGGDATGYLKEDIFAKDVSVAKVQSKISPDCLELLEMRGRDYYEIERIRQQNIDWLRPWEATVPPEHKAAPIDFPRYVRECERSRRQGRNVPFQIVLDQQRVGQLTISSIQRGPMDWAVIGYWIAADQGGRGITTAAVAMALDACFEVLRLHRVEINIRPENVPSLKVAQKLRLREEGSRLRYLHIGGEWTDHRCFAMTAEEIPAGGVVVDLEQRLLMG